MITWLCIKNSPGVLQKIIMPTCLISFTIIPLKPQLDTNSPEMIGVSSLQQNYNDRSIVNSLLENNIYNCKISPKILKLKLFKMKV